MYAYKSALIYTNACTIIQEITDFDSVINFLFQNLNFYI